MRNHLSYVTLTGSEQALREKLKQFVHGRGLLRATLTVRERVCGKPNCKCVDGMKHKSTYIVSRQGGETRQLFIPKHLEEKARLWVKNYAELQDLLETISDQCWRKLEEREE